MKKSFKFKIVSLALCAISCLVLAMATFTKTVKTANATTQVTATTMHTLEGFTINETASVRRTEPMGIRFTTVVSAEQKTKIVNLLGGDASKVQFGTLILPTDMLGSKELTHDTPSVVIAVPTKWNTETVYTAVLGGPGKNENLGPSYYDRPISARSFAINTETGEVYYTENTASRSIGFVAYKASVAGDENSYVTTVANATTKELVFNENVSIHNAESEGSIVVSNEYDKSSANAFAFKIGGIVDLDTTVSYTSSNANAISVENGKLVAVGEGVSTVTASVSINGEIVDTLTKTISTTEYAPSTTYKILVPKNADSYETQAAEKLQSIIKEATGVNFAIVTESGNETTAEKYISIGDTALAKEECDVSNLTKDTASRVKTVDNTVFVRGVTKIATLYGVQQLLGDVVGYEYYMDNSYRVDKKKEVAIEDKDYIPAIEYEVAQTEGYGAELATEHAVVSYIDNVVPVGADDYTGVVHNSVLVLNDGRTDKTSYSSSNAKYKEWYATYKVDYVIWSTTTYRTDGDGYKLELCYTAHGNETARNEMLATVADRMFAQMQKYPYDRIGFSLSDAQNWCECNYCSDKGNAADNMLEFLADLVPILKGKLENAGDQRANTFRIFSLFYNSTNVPATKYADYMTKDIGKHLEIWFAETRADYVVSLDNAASRWNDDVLGKFNTWKTIANAYDADLLWWGYYANVKDAFTPYNSINALRGNYALAVDSGVDYMFNQMIAYNVNWAKLKYYLMSELRWNAKPDDTTWNGWIADYMKGAFGDGADAMTEYYEAWTSWATTNQDNFLMDGEYADNFSTTTSIGKNPSEIYSTSTLTLDTLKSWLNSCNKALASLDKNDSKYQTYYNNIVLERLTPLYLIMVNYGLTPSYSNQSTNSIKSYSVKNSANVTPYAQDFLDGVELWGVTAYGEGRPIEPLITALENAVSGITEYEDSARQIVVSGTSITLANANISAGDYTATLTSGNGVITATGVTASNGSVTLTLGSAPAVGVSYDVVLRSSSKVITFTDVFVVTGTISNGTELRNLIGTTVEGYYVVTADFEYTSAINIQEGEFKGTLDGNGHTITGLVTRAKGMFCRMAGATVKNLTLESANPTATGPVFATTATNTVFENVTVTFAKNGKGLLVTNETNVTYNNVTVYTSADVSTVPYGITVVKGSQVDTDLTFYVVDGQNELWIKDANLAKGKYQVNINGEIKEYTSFTNGRLLISLGYIKAGETIEVSCSNGEENRIYSVCCVAKITEGSVNGESLDEFDGNESTLGYVNGTYVQQMVTETITQDWWQTTNYPNEVVDSNGKTREQLSAVIVMPEDKDWVSVDISVSANVGTADLFHAWGTVDGALTAFGAIGATNGTTSAGLQAQFLDKYGFRVSSLSANTVYKMQLIKDGTEFFKLANVIRDGMTVYFANVTYGTGELPTSRQPLFDGASYYDGDETALGFSEGSEVYEYAGNGSVSFAVDSTNYDYVDVQFVIDSGNGYFFMYGFANGEQLNVGYVIDPANIRMNDGAPYSNPTKPDRRIEIYDANGAKVSSLMKEKVLYTLRVYIKVGELDKISISNSGATMYFANVTYGNDVVIPAEITPVTYADGSNLPLYEGSIDFGSDYVFEGAMADGYNNGANVATDPTVYDYVDVDFTVTSGAWYFMVWLWGADGNILSGYYFVAENAGAQKAHAIFGDGYAQYNGSGAGNTRVQVLDEKGNPVYGVVRSLGTIYTLRVYICDENVTNVRIGQSNVNMLFANVSYGYELPENVIKYSTDGGHTGEVLPKYTGDATAYGFGAEDYVFEGAMTSSWNDRVIIPVDSTNYDYMDVEFVVTSGAWYFNAWVVAAGGMLDGSYLVAENADNKTYGSGFAVYNDNPNTDKVDGKTRIQVLDTNGNVVTGGRTVGTRYILRVYTNNESLTQVQLGQDNTTILFANVTYGIEETIVGTTNTSCVTVYDGDETTLGFADGSRVYTYVGTDASTDKASFKVDSTYDYVEVQFVIGSGDGYFFGYALNGGSYLNNGSSYVIDPSNLRLASGSAMDRIIQVYDANGNLASTLMSTNTLYTLRIYTDGMDEFRIAKAGSTIYLANVTFGNDAAVEKPEEVIVWGEGKEELPQYAGNNADIGFDDDDYVFEQVCTTSSWDCRAHIGNNSSADFLVFDFSTNNPQNLTVWFTRNGNVIGGYSNIIAQENAGIGANESPARTIYIFDADGNAATAIVANAKYTVWVYLGGAESFHGVAIGNGDSITVYYANVRYVSGTDNILRQGEANSLLAEYTGDVTDIGFEAGTFVQTLTGTSDIWIEDIYANRARISADGTQTYIAVDFIVKDAITGDFLFKIWSPNSTFDVKSGGDCTYYKAKVIGQDGWVVRTIEPGVKYTLIVQDAGATYLAIGAYCNNTIHFANVTYGTGEPEVYTLLSNNNGILATYEGDETQIGFSDGEIVQQATTGSWGESTGVRLYGDENSYVSVMFSLASDFNLSSGNLLYGWAHDPNDTTNNTYLDAYSCYVIGSNASSSCRVFAVNGNAITDNTLKANTVYMLEIYFATGVVYYNIGGVPTDAITIYFAPKSVKTYSTSYSASITYKNNAMTLYQGNETDIGFNKGEVIWQLTTTDIEEGGNWYTAPSGGGYSRSQLLAVVPTTVGQVVSIRFAVSEDFSSTSSLFFIWGYPSGSNSATTQAISLSTTGDCCILDVNGNAVNSLSANTVYVLKLYMADVAKYEIGNIYSTGMTTYFSSDIAYVDYTA